MTPPAWQPDTTVIYTPEPRRAWLPQRPAIAVDLNANITRVLNSDYFGESKKGGLRMWNNIVYNRGGLALHAGCKVIPVGGQHQDRPHRRPVRDREDHDDLHHASSAASRPRTTSSRSCRTAGSTPPRTAASPRPSALNPEFEPIDLQRHHQAGRLPGERLRGRRTAKVDFFDTSLHQERPHHLAVRLRQPVAAERGRRGRVPADPEPEREHRCPAWPGSTGPRRRPTSCSARPPGPRQAARTRRASSCGCRAPTRSSPCDMADMGNRMLELLDQPRA